MIAATIFSDPLDHSMKYTKKKFEECNCSMEQFKKQIFEEVTTNPWTGQLDHFLFNSSGSSNEDTSMETKDKVKRAMQLLKEEFDIVQVQGKGGDFAAEILKITGWTTSSEVKEASVSDTGGIIYSKDLVSKYGKMSTKNGDNDFIDAVNHVYHNNLAFLMNQ